MPTTYTHDLFGKKVYRKLPVKMREIIRENGDLYRIGLHGPDILFYYIIGRQVHRYGVKMHRETARDFFERGIKMAQKDNDRPLLAYLLGFGCHYLLDSACHPFVNQMAAENVISHTLLEKEFDRTLMLETHKNPYHFYPSDCIVPKRSYARVIHKAIPQISAEKIFWSLKMQKLITNAMVYDNGGRRIRALRLIGLPVFREKTDKHLEHFMSKEPVWGSAQPVKELHVCYDEALMAGAGGVAGVLELFFFRETLSVPWDKTYSG